MIGIGFNGLRKMVSLGAISGADNQRQDIVFLKFGRGRD